MSSTILKLLLLLGIIGHACNMYCDRILSIFPNGQLKLENFKDLNNKKKWHTFLKGYPPKFHHIADIYPAVSISNHRYITYRCDDSHVGLDDPAIRE